MTIEALISEHEPRKGTETYVNIPFGRIFTFQNTNPERGRKQHGAILIPSSGLTNFRTRTPKGDGN